METVEQRHRRQHDFASKVDVIVEQQYDITDGGDLCYNLMESGVIPADATVEQAARTVAQHLLQA